MSDLPAFSLDLMPDDLKTEPSLKDFKTFPDLAKSYVNAVKKLGVPGELLMKLNTDGSIPPEVWKRLGKPEKAEDYKFPENLKTQFQDQYKKQVIEFADKHNLTKAQFEELAHFTDGLAQERLAANQAKAAADRTAAENALKSSLGNAYEQTVNYAKDAEEILEAPGLLEKLKAVGLDTDPLIIGTLAKIGRMAGEDTLIDGNNSKRFALTPNEAKAELKALRVDKDFQERLNSKHSPGHADAVARMKELLEASAAA